jgi:hypothetical protein
MISHFFKNIQPYHNLGHIDLLIFHICHHAKIYNISSYYYLEYINVPKQIIKNSKK